VRANVILNQSRACFAQLCALDPARLALVIPYTPPIAIFAEHFERQANFLIHRDNLVLAGWSAPQIHLIKPQGDKTRERQAGLAAKCLRKNVAVERAGKEDSAEQ